MKLNRWTIVQQSEKIFYIFTFKDENNNFYEICTQKPDFEKSSEMIKEQGASDFAVKCCKEGLKL